MEMPDFDAKATLRKIAAELREHPEHWCQFASAYDAEFTRCFATSEKAVTWCLLGHISKECGEKNDFNPNEEYYVKRNAVRVLLYNAGIGSIPVWNDRKERTVEDVIEVCEKAANAS